MTTPAAAPEPGLDRATFVLVHGAFRGGWAWRRVRTRLAAAGHDVYAPSLVGAGERVDEIARVTSLDVWVDDLERLLEVEDLRDVVLVGHSQGGLVTTALAARVPERLRGVVHLDAAVPDPGERAVDLTPGPGPLPPRTTVVAPRAQQADRWTPQEVVDWMTPRLTPTPVGPSLDPLPEVPAGVRRAYVFCAGTPAGYPSTVTRARCEQRGIDHRVLEAGHDAPLTAPAQVVAELLRAAAHLGSVGAPEAGPIGRFVPPGSSEGG